MGSSKLAYTLMDHGLVDEYQLWVHPVVLDAGKKLFREGGPRIGLSLADSRTTATASCGVASFSAPEPHFPRLTTGSVQVSSKTGQLQARLGGRSRS
jgi:X-X-X-Leu-X-X-Gly heptad repeat protein